MHRDDAAEMVDVVWILEAVTDEVGALADNCLADLARTLAGDDEREAKLAPFFGDPFIGQAGKTMATIFISSSRAGIIMSLFEDKHPGMLIT